MASLPEQLLAEVASHGSISSLELAEKLKEDHQKIIGAIKSILSLGEVISAEQQLSKHWELTDEGTEVAEKGSHEGVTFNAIPSDGISQPELMKNIPNAKVGFSKAMALGWIVLDKSGTSGPKVRRKVDAVQDTVQSNLQALKNGAKLDDSLLAEYKKRKLVQEVVVKSYAVSKGPNFTTSISKQETDLTSDMLATGAWKEKTFKPYNLNALGATIPKGHLHPLLKVREEYRQIFLEMGFSEMPTNNYVESSFWNFDALFQPQQHPARDAHDTFFLSEPKYANDLPPEYMEKVQKVHSEGGHGSIGYRYDWKVEEARKNLLRTHTTAVSTRMLYKLAQEPEFKPTKYFSIDRVFRNETLDATHLAEFHQIEGVVADYGLTLGDLIGVIYAFFKKLGIEKLRFKPAYNPYTEPSMEIFSYHPGLKKWVEIGNSGLFRPEMLLPMGLPEGVNVIAWGLSLERPTMIKYGIDNIRDLVGPRVDLQMVYDNPICRLDKYGHNNSANQADEPRTEDLESVFNSIWTRASQLAEELNAIRKNAGLKKLKIPSYSELTSNAKPTPQLTKVTLNGVPSCVTIVSDPAHPPLGLYELVREISQVIPLSCSSHLHSSLLGTPVDTAAALPTVDMPSHSLRVTLVYRRVGRLSEVSIGSKSLKLGQADLLRLFGRIYEAVTGKAVYESVEWAGIDRWLDLQEDCEVQGRKNLKEFVSRVAKRLSEGSWLVGVSKGLADIFVSKYLKSVKGTYPAQIENWLQRCAD